MAQDCLGKSRTHQILTQLPGYRPQKHYLSVIASHPHALAMDVSLNVCSGTDLLAAYTLFHFSWVMTESTSVCDQEKLRLPLPKRMYQTSVTKLLHYTFVGLGITGKFNDNTHQLNSHQDTGAYSACSFLRAPWNWAFLLIPPIKIHHF